MYAGQSTREAYDLGMNVNLKELPIEDRIRLVEDLWDSIASDQKALPLTAEQIAELDRRLDKFEADGDTGRLASEVISDIRRRL
jgi:putative addiction module component (TIGR02574 family)